MIYRALFKLVLQRMDAETAHALAARSMRVVAKLAPVRWMLERILRPTDPALRVETLGMTAATPLGVCSVDKGASWFDGLWALGFGYVEIGTVTALAQPGNDRPRVYRLPHERAIVNWMGFPNPGAVQVADRLRRYAGDAIVGVNVGKSKATPLDRAVDDYRAAVRELAPFARYVVLNVSSPNTPGLRDMQHAEHLRPLIEGVHAELAAVGAEVPLLVKLSPDLADADIDAVADICVELEVAGIIAVNTTTDPDVLLSRRDYAGMGGISGAPLKSRAVEVLRRLYGRVGDRLVLISVGGIENEDDAWERILSGASLVQAHTGFVYGGPLWPRRVNRGLARRVREAGCTSIQELVGARVDSRAADTEAPSADAARGLPAVAQAGS